MNTQKKKKSFVPPLDLFSQKVTLYMGGNQTHNTKFGFILSLGVVIFLVYILVYYTFQFLNLENMTYTHRS